MRTNTVNVAFKDDLLKQIDALAREESRSRSELIREAARLYVERKKVWKKIFSFGSRQVAAQGLSEDDIAREIRLVRQHKRK